jgi:hypothetical protein
MPERKQDLDTLAISLLLVCCLFWGFQQILIKATVAEVPPLWQAALRFAGATVLLVLWCLARGVKLFERDGTLGAGLLAGGLFAAEFSCIYLGLRDTTASRLTVFLYTSPFVWRCCCHGWCRRKDCGRCSGPGFSSPSPPWPSLSPKASSASTPRASCAVMRWRWRPARSGASPRW